MANGYVPNGYFTFHKEGTDTTSSVLHHPSRYSGVTIGRGYDLKERNVPEIYTDLTACGMSREDANIVKTGYHKSGSQADKFVKEYKNKIAVFSRANQVRLFQRILPKYIATVQRVYGRVSSVVNEKDLEFVGKEGSKVSWVKTPFEDINNLIIDVAIDLNFQGLYYKHTAAVISKNSIDLFIEYLSQNRATTDYEKGGTHPSRDRIGYLKGEYYYDSF